MPLFPGSAKLCGHGAYAGQEPIISQIRTHRVSFPLVPASRAAMLVGPMLLRQIARRKVFNIQTENSEGCLFLVGAEVHK
jgi:hypothetical protein